MSSNKKKLILNTVSVISQLRLQEIEAHHYDTTGQYWDTDIGTDKETKCSAATIQGFGHVRGESLVVEKESDDPYLDFKYSMLQMILEKEIYSKDDLKELLNCFLKLNSPH
ncbi:Alpha/beta-Hydrolases superfamily protein isoform 1 [Hibiscus syriacus]|uniref:Transcription repressor n=1 Tax=Hibiscus syriacus TaxID=106335 RepID=A0A6A3B5I3_HIBSY|nr:Alpha/beta-Hydrolases superfamily protein isoform 1 [Hibiscus syriacus]